MDINTLFPSQYLKASDLKGVPRQVVIENCTTEKIGDELKPMLILKGIDRGLVLTKTNATVIADAYGAETNAWIGKGLTLFVTPVTFQGRVTDGIRVRTEQSPPTVSPKQSAPQADPLTGPVTNNAATEPNDDIPW